jgi:SAM-dependent methyltransferase
MKNESIRQKFHYESMHSEYQDHYFDTTSMKFRNIFIYNRIFAGLDLNNKLVIDLASGGGYNSLAVLERFPKAEIIGLDISAKACADYRINLKRDAFEADLTLGKDLGIQADIAMIFGGIHHCISNLNNTFKTIHLLLKPGGILLMYEPNSRFFLEAVRQWWYKFDRYFDAKTEAALDHDEILQSASHLFSLIDCQYLGGPAYFLIFNSLVFRIPLSLKPYIAPPLFLAEILYNKLQSSFLFPSFIARWQKKSISA